MDIEPLSFQCGLDQYEKQAEELLAAFNIGDLQAVQLVRERLPRFLNPEIPWLPTASESEVRDAALDVADAQLAIARWYDFQNWQALAEYVEAVAQQTAPVFRFESAVEAVINGDLSTLTSLLRGNPELVRARSTRVTHFDPAVHRATLLHYLAANGVEGYRQKTPGNAVDVARILLYAGSEVDALADMYGGQCTAMSLLVSSCHPARAGVQVELVDTLLDFGASVEGRGMGRWVSPLLTALVFGYAKAAEALVRRGAMVENIAVAAGLGRLQDAQVMIAKADAESRHRALALAAQLGHVDIVRLLVDSGEDPNRYNPEGFHSHSTPLHQAILPGHLDVVRLLVERRARLDIRDKIYQGTPLGWALYAGQTEIADYLRSQGARTAGE